MPYFTRYRPLAGPMPLGRIGRAPVTTGGLLDGWDQPPPRRIDRGRLIDETVSAPGDEDDLLSPGVLALYREQLDADGLDFLKRGPRSPAERLAFVQRVHPETYRTAEPLPEGAQRRFREQGAIDERAAFLGPDGIVYRRGEDSGEPLAARIRRGFESAVGGYERPSLEDLHAGTTSPVSTGQAASGDGATERNSLPAYADSSELPPQLHRADGKPSPYSRPKPPTETELNAIEAQFRSYAGYGWRHGYNVAAEALERFLNGTGGTMVLDPRWVRRSRSVQKAEQRVQRYFEDWMTGNETPQNSAELIKENLLNLKDGESITRSSLWDRDFWEWRSLDHLATLGDTNLRGYGDFRFSRQGNRILFEGVVRQVLEDRYDWEPGKFQILPDADLGLPAVEIARHNDALKLQKYRGAKPFDLYSQWRRRVAGSLVVKSGRLILDSVRWSDMH